MTDLVTVAIIVTVPPTIASVVGAWVNLKKQDKVAEVAVSAAKAAEVVAEKTHLLVNSKMAEVIAERDALRARVAELETPPRSPGASTTREADRSQG